MIKNNRKLNVPVPSSLLNATDELERIANGERELIRSSVYKGEYKESGGNGQ